MQNIFQIVQNAFARICTNFPELSIIYHIPAKSILQIYTQVQTNENCAKVFEEVTSANIDSNKICAIDEEEEQARTSEKMDTD